MRTKTKYILLPALLVLVAGIILFNSNMGAITGSTVLSLSQVDMKSSFSPLDGRVWVYTFTQGGLGQYVTGSVTAAQADAAYTAGAERPEDNFRLDVVYSQQECQYPIKITSTGTPYFDGHIYTVRRVEWNGLGAMCDLSIQRMQQACGPETPLLGYSEVSLFGSCNAICGNRRDNQIGYFENPQIESVFTVDVDSPDNPSPVTFRTFGNISGRVGEYTYIQYSGNLVTGRSCPSQAPYRPVFVDQQWKITDANSYNQYVSAMNNLIANTKSDRDFDDINGDAVNSAASNALTTRNWALVRNPASTTTGMAVLDVQDIGLLKPVITAFIEANWIGIVTPVGRPQIVSIQSPVFTASEGTIKVDVKNVGLERELVKVYGTCSDSRFRISGNLENTIYPGQTVPFFLPVSASAGTITSATCVITAQGVQYSDSKSHTVTVNIPGSACNVAGQTVCQDGDIKECDVSIGNYKMKTDCQQGCQYSSTGAPVCKENVNPDNPPEPQNNIVWWLLGGVTVMILITIVVIMSNKKTGGGLF